MKQVAGLPVRLLLAVLGGAPVFALAVALALTWVDPALFADPSWLRAATTLVLLEIVFLHSGAFMAIGPVMLSRLWQRLAWFAGLVLFYGVGLVLYVRWTGSSYIGWVVLGVVFARLLMQVLLRDRRSVIMALQRSVVGTFVILATVLLPLLPFPPLGITEAVREGAFGWQDDLLASYPHRFLVWGSFYFFLMALIEALAGWRIIDWTDEEVDDTWRRLRAR